MTYMQSCTIAAAAAEAAFIGQLGNAALGNPLGHA